ncbi:penicillin-binding protein 1B [Chiayiivirga flava]|uniref:Penicillin-binding protein 1B n=1 Tax=Chiayiivirga flava TaxID=659595 RepID=A0A7W8D5C8_9GAMM|nr:penicillin-binding protein 1B [Chiayiivirga flava]
MPRRSKTPTPPPSRWTTRWKPIFWRVLPLALAAFGIVLGFFVPYLWVLDERVQEEFGRLTWQVPTRVYARPLALSPGLPMSAEALEDELAAARYAIDGEARQAGTYARDGGRFVIATRGIIDLDGRTPPQRIELTVGDGRVRTLSVAGAPVKSARVDPARIATLYGEKQEERRLVRLQDAPPLLLTTLQAVEDRDFKHHIGIDVGGMLRAAWVNLREADARQGASTLTQQLVRNLYLTRDKSFARKFREILYALVIEARFDKSTILEAYLNQAYMGQQGGQAVHGVAAGAEFWFGRDLDQLGTSEIALLVGLIKGPSEYDPRKHPERATQRRNVVLRQMADTGLITDAELELARARPLGVTPRASLSRDRYPAFMDLVRDQLQRDYPADALRGAGLSVLTTLAPSVQGRSEHAVTAQLKALTQDKRPPLEAGLVVTDTGNGEVLAMVGGRDVAAHGFNRALQAQRPVGSLLKPFVYLLALAQPGRYSLASSVDDAPLTLRVAGGKTWSPENSDNVSHGRVTLVDALAHSYNQATVRIGMDIGVDRLARLIKVLAEIDAAPHPSLLLGAVDLSPLQMAQAFQFLASGGQVQPLRAVRGVLDAQGKALNRYDTALEPAQPGDAIAARLVSLALQETVRSGTARALLSDGLGHLASAGKTGTSNDSRDSWYAGYTGSHLAVVWVGNDDNQPTGLYGATGAMKVWSALFKALPSAPLRVSEDGLEAAWVDVGKYAVTDEDCPQARRFLFVHGYTPEHYERCPMARLRGWFGREGD